MRAQITEEEPLVWFAADESISDDCLRLPLFEQSLRYPVPTANDAVVCVGYAVVCAGATFVVGSPGAAALGGGGAAAPARYTRVRCDVMSRLGATGPATLALFATLLQVAIWPPVAIITASVREGCAAICLRALRAAIIGAVLGHVLEISAARAVGIFEVIATRSWWRRRRWRRRSLLNSSRGAATLPTALGTFAARLQVACG